jgi:hypothetical protein
MYRHKNERWLVCGHVPHGPTFHNTSIPKDKCGLKQEKTRRSTEYKNTSMSQMNGVTIDDFPTLHPAYSCKNCNTSQHCSIQHPKCPISSGRF